MTYYLPGGHNCICERTGFKVKSSGVRREWTNQTVRNKSWEARHPQDFLRAKADRQAVEGATGEAEDTFLATNEVTAESL